jgi:hypothetical protein
MTALAEAHNVNLVTPSSIRYQATQNQPNRTQLHWYVQHEEVDSSLDTWMTCVDDYELKASIYDNFIQINKIVYVLRVGLIRIDVFVLRLLI